MGFDGRRDSAVTEMKRKKLSLTDEARNISHLDTQLQPVSILTYRSLTLPKPVVILCTRCSITKPCNISTQFICVSVFILTINTAFFPISINRLFMDRECVLCEVASEVLSIY